MNVHMGQLGTADLGGVCPPNDHQLAVGAAAVPSNVMQAPHLLRAAATDESSKLGAATHAPTEVILGGAGRDMIVDEQHHAGQLGEWGSIKRPRSKPGGRKPRVVPSADGLYSDVDDEPDYVPGQRLARKGSKRVISPNDSSPSAGSLQLDSEEEAEVKPKKKKAKLALKASGKAGAPSGFKQASATASKGGSAVKRCVSASSGAAAPLDAATTNAASHSVTGAGRKRAVTTGSLKSKVSVPVTAALAAAATATGAPAVDKAVNHATALDAAHMAVQPQADVHKVKGLTQLTQLAASETTNNVQIPSVAAPAPVPAECIADEIDVCAADAKPDADSLSLALLADTVEGCVPLDPSSVPLHCAMGAPAAMVGSAGEFVSQVRKGNSTGAKGSKREFSSKAKAAVAADFAAGNDVAVVESAGGQEGGVGVRRKDSGQVGGISAPPAAENEQTGRGVKRQASSKAKLSAAAALAGYMAAATVKEAGSEGDNTGGINLEAFPKVTWPAAGVEELAAAPAHAAITAKLGRSTLADPNDGMNGSVAGKGTGVCLQASSHVLPHQVDVNVAGQAQLVDGAASGRDGQRKSSGGNATAKDDAAAAFADVGQAVGGGEGVKRRVSSMGKAKATVAVSAAEQVDDRQHSHGQGVKRKASSKAKAVAQGATTRLEAQTVAIEAGDEARKMDSSSSSAAAAAAAAAKTKAARVGGLARPGGRLGKPLAALCANTNGPSAAAGEAEGSHHTGSGANISSAGRCRVAGLRRPAGAFKAPRMEQKLKQ